MFGVDFRAISTLQRFASRDDVAIAGMHRSFALFTFHGKMRCNRSLLLGQIAYNQA